MKVLKPGARAGWSSEVTCAQRAGGCGATLLVEEKDLGMGCRSGYDYLGDANGPEGVCFECPSCKTTHFVSVPAQVRSRVEARR
jgi:hypothetical protein